MGSVDCQLSTLVELGNAGFRLLLLLCYVSSLRLVNEAKHPFYSITVIDQVDVMDLHF